MAAPIAIGLLLNTMKFTRKAAEAAYYLALWLGFLIIGTILSYLSAGFSLPLLDSQFNNIDRTLGFDWISWFNFTQSHPALNFVLTSAYTSMFPQILTAMIFFAWTEENSSNAELWWTSMITLIIVSLISGLLPALGSFHYYNKLLEKAIHLPDLVAIRNKTMTVLPILVLKGIITLPSFHAASAILLTYPYRRHRLLFGVAISINLLMLVSTPFLGGHYLIDVLTGAACAVFSIFIFRATRRRLR